MSIVSKIVGNYVQMVGSYLIHLSFWLKGEKPHNHEDDFRYEAGIAYDVEEIINDEYPLEEMIKMWKNIPYIRDERIQDNLGYTDEFKRGWNEMVGFIGSPCFNEIFFNDFQKKYPNFSIFAKYMFNKITLWYDFSSVY